MDWIHTRIQAIKIKERLKRYLGILKHNFHKSNRNNQMFCNFDNTEIKTLYLNDSKYKKDQFSVLTVLWFLVRNPFRSITVDQVGEVTGWQVPKNSNEQWAMYSVELPLSANPSMTPNKIKKPLVSLNRWGVK